MAGTSERALPVIDVTELCTPGHDRAARARVAREIDDACRTLGFFSIVGHGVDPDLCASLLAAGRAFFALPDPEKARIGMERGGRAWRGWFPLGGELTSGRPDHKEGIYFGAELGDDDARVQASTPLHGPNLFPERPATLRDLVLTYMAQLQETAANVMRAIALGLGIDEAWFARTITGDPLVLFRMFHYPPVADGRWSVGEHTDYGLLTILLQDGTGGLQVHGPGGWVDVPPIEGAFVCNIGDMLERMTSGRYRSTPHRVRNLGDRDRLSCPFFYDPGWDARVQPVPAGPSVTARNRERWDGDDPLGFEGTYGDYITAKVAKVFPARRDDLR